MEPILMICLGLVCAGLGAVVGALTERTKERKDIMAKVSALAGLLTPIIGGLTDVATAVADVGPQLEKAKAEIIAAMGGEAEIPEEAMEKLNQLGVLAEGLKTSAAALKTTSQALDDLNADAPAPGGETPAPGSDN